MEQQPIFQVTVWNMDDYANPWEVKRFKTLSEAHSYVSEMCDKGYDPELSWNEAAGKWLKANNK